MSMGIMVSGLRKLMMPMTKKNTNSATCSPKAIPSVLQESPLSEEPVCSNPIIA